MESHTTAGLGKKGFLCLTQKEKLEGQWAQSSAALLLELPKSQRAYAAQIFDR